MPAAARANPAPAPNIFLAEAKSALKGYVNFLGDDEVKPFEKILALIPAVAAGFVGFSAVKGIAKSVKNFVTTLKGVGKAAPMVKKGMGGRQMPAALRQTPSDSSLQPPSGLLLRMQGSG